MKKNWLETDLANVVAWVFFWVTVEIGLGLFIGLSIWGYMLLIFGCILVGGVAIIIHAYVCRNEGNKLR